MKTLALMLAVFKAHALLRFFRSIGALGLLILGVCDSSFLFMPLSNDILLIALVSSEEAAWHWILYTMTAAIGSVIGVALVDLVMRKVGEEGLEKFVSPKQLEKLKGKMKQRGLWAVFLATMMPPPFPFTAVIMVASALQCARWEMLGAVFVGRVIRFSVESILALYFGRRFLRYLRSDVLEYFVYGFIIMAVIGSIITIVKWFSASRKGKVTTSHIKAET